MSGSRQKRKRESIEEPVKPPQTTLREDVQRGKSIANELASQLIYAGSSPSMRARYDSGRELVSIFEEQERKLTDINGNSEDLIKQEIDRIYTILECADPMDGDEGGIINYKLDRKDENIKQRVLNEVLKAEEVDLRSRVDVRIKKVLVNIVHEKIMGEHSKAVEDLETLEKLKRRLSSGEWRV